ncbi:MAG: hypothetical protein GTO46_09735 [Gemmatimonadetes bacterium]|nr:hypothetical protein [Gemmatimonadota bacterium]NIO31893.1 hypothetical protein [Gemmatimonadota bacterium]
MALTRKLLWETKAPPPATRDVVPLLQSIDRRLGYLLVTLWVSIAAAAAFWVIQKAVVVAGW